MKHCVFIIIGVCHYKTRIGRKMPVYEEDMYCHSECSIACSRPIHVMKHLGSPGTYTGSLFGLSVLHSTQSDSHNLHANLAQPNITPYICLRIGLSNKHDKAFMMYKALPVNLHSPDSLLHEG